MGGEDVKYHAESIGAKTLTNDLQREIYLGEVFIMDHSVCKRITRYLARGSLGTRTYMYSTYMYSTWHALTPPSSLRSPPIEVGGPSTYAAGPRYISI